MPVAVVIGGGIVGACSALALLRQGFDVTILERDTPGHGATFGNAGSIGLASVPPLGMPGVMRAAPRMLLDRDHALAVRWRALPTTVPWLRRFARASAPDRVEAIARARAALLTHAGDAYDALLDEIGRAELITTSGLIAAYESRADFEAARFGVELRRRNGVAVHELSGDAVRAAEPAISDRAVAGYFFPAVRTTVDPLVLARAVIDAVRERGARVARERVRGFVRTDDRISAVVTDIRRHDCDLAVLSAGVWSRELARQLGDDIPLVAERGYHVMIAQPKRAPRIPMLAGSRHVTLTMMQGGLRLTTMAEFTAIDAPPDHARAERIFRRAVGIVRDLEFDAASRWVGSRPSTPDSLPVIGRASRYRNVIYAFGHGHLGVTFGAITGSLVGRLARDQRPNLDLAPYRPDRAYDGSHLAAA